MRARVQIPLTPPKNTTTHRVVVFFNEEWDLKAGPAGGTFRCILKTKIYKK